MKLVEALHFPHATATELDHDHADTPGRHLSESLVTTGISLVVALLMFLGLFVSVPVLP